MITPGNQPRAWSVFPCVTERVFQSSLSDRSATRSWERCCLSKALHGRSLVIFRLSLCISADQVRGLTKSSLHLAFLLSCPKLGLYFFMLASAHSAVPICATLKLFDISHALYVFSCEDWGVEHRSESLYLSFRYSYVLFNVLCNQHLTSCPEKVSI